MPIGQDLENLLKSSQRDVEKEKLASRKREKLERREHRRRDNHDLRMQQRNERREQRRLEEQDLSPEERAARRATRQEARERKREEKRRLRGERKLQEKRLKVGFLSISPTKSDFRQSTPPNHNLCQLCEQAKLIPNSLYGNRRWGRELHYACGCLLSRTYTPTYTHV